MRCPLAFLSAILLCQGGYVRISQAADASGKSLIEEGVELRRRGKDLEALEKFRAAYAQTASPRALAQIALAEQALGLWVEAEKHLSEALGDLQDPWIKANRKVLDEAFNIVKSHVGAIDVRANVAGAIVRLNGKSIGSLPFPEPVHVVSGSAILELSAEGFQTVLRNVVVLPQELSRETFDLVPEAPRVAAPVAPPEVAPVTEPSPMVSDVAAPERPQAPTIRTAISKDTSNFRLAGWVTGGAAVAGIGLGVLEYFVRESHARKWNDDSRCLVDGKTRRENCGRDADAASTAGAVSAAGFIAGGLLGVASAVLFTLASPDAEEAVSVTSTGQLPALSCGAGPGAIGISCSGPLF